MPKYQKRGEGQDFIHQEQQCSRSREGFVSRGARQRNGRFDLLHSNITIAQATWGVMAEIALRPLAKLTKLYGLSLSAGNLVLLDGRWYITHSGLLHIAPRRHCFAIKTSLQSKFSNCVVNRWVFKATVY